MNLWRERFSDHKIHEDLAEVESILADLVLPQDAASAIDDVNRLKTVVDAFAAHVKSLVPELTPLSTLDKWAQPLSEMRQNLELLRKDGHLGNLKQANNNADAIASMSLLVPLPSSGPELAKTLESVASTGRGISPPSWGSHSTRRNMSKETRTSDVSPLRPSKRSETLWPT